MEMSPGHKSTETLVAQHNIGAQYLEPVPYASAVRMPAVLPLPLPPLPVIVSPDQAQMQVYSNSIYLFDLIKLV